MRLPSIAASLLLLACSQPKTAEPVATPPELATAPVKDERIEAVREFIAERAPRSTLAIVREDPFVVVGDEDEATVRKRAEGTVRWAVTMLKKDFFDRDPDRDLTIWLFAGEESYRKHALAFWGERPDTPYGYYSSSNNALVMNISTGGGTLVHELVHPYVEANFPEAPAWLNEGLGSLYEQSAERGGKIVGLLNWRLSGLKDAIRDGETVPFETLLAMDENTFYGEGSGTHYAQARYLLYYLQEQGKLRSFYADFSTNAEKDPDGIAALRKALARRDIKRFQRDWEAWVLALR